MLLDFPRLTLISFVSIRQPDQPPRGWHLHNRHEEDRNDTAHIIRCARQRLPHLPLPNPADEYVALDSACSVYYNFPVLWCSWHDDSFSKR